LMCGGAGLYALAALAALVLVGCLHYLWWGHSLNQEVAPEREEELIRADMERSAALRPWESPYEEL
jgi:hypothetical protein